MSGRLTLQLSKSLPDAKIPKLDTAELVAGKHQISNKSQISKSNDQKHRANQNKHKVSFEEAQTVFFDEYAIEYDDPDHSETEDRFLMLGLSQKIRILLVSYTLRNEGAEIRIISARKATKNEQKAYSGA